MTIHPHIINRSLVVIGLLAAVLAGPASAEDPTAAAGREVLARYRQAVVTIKLAVNYRVTFGGRDQKSETKSEAIGAVIDPAGLTVMSLSAVDPSKALEQMLAKQLRRSGQDNQFNVDSEATSIMILLEDGAEILCELVLRDEDLDLAYIRPKEPPAEPLTCVDITVDPPVQVLDSVIALHRLGKVANRVPTVSVERINAVVAKPRPFYVLGAGQGASGVGAPVFTADGTLIGIVLIRSVAQEGDVNMSAMFSGANSMGLMPVIIPTADVREGAEQAREIKTGD